jgi:hypothetical protein
MRKQSAVLVVVALMLVVGFAALSSRTRGSILPAAASPLAPTAELHFAQVRAEYIDLEGNRDEADTTLTIVNKSMSKTLYLGDVSALGPDGLAEVLAVHTGLNGVGIPPLGSIDLPVDATSFPGLQPKLETDSRGVESVLLSFQGSREAIRLTAAILLNQPGTLDNRVLTRVESHFVVK